MRLGLQILLVFLISEREQRVQQRVSIKKDDPNHPVSVGKAESQPRPTNIEMQTLVRERAKAAAADLAMPPHTFVQQGEYSGWVWTMAASAYDRTQALANWPPATYGLYAIPGLQKWYGHVRDGHLYLCNLGAAAQHPTKPLSKSDKVKSEKRPGVGLSKIIVEPQPGWLEIEVVGCSVEIVTEGLRGKTRWWRKAPLDISHSSR